MNKNNMNDKKRSRRCEKYIFLLFILIFCTSILNVLSAQAGPRLLFSDLTWGPKTGWEGSATKGAAVSIWGDNFGTTRGSSYVTVGGVNLTSDSNYAEWGATGTANMVARGMERITFWLNSSMADGAGTISITVNGVKSNTLPFTIASGCTIYFISPTGNNSNNGLTAATAWRDLYMFSPGHNPSGDGTYICYVKGGTYTTVDNQGTSGSYIYLAGPYGETGTKKALIGYPGEIPIVDGYRSLLGRAFWSPYDPEMNNMTISKIKIDGSISTSAGGAMSMGYGTNNRAVGNAIVNMRPTSQEQNGWIWVTASNNIHIYGNYLYNIGYDSMGHTMYIKSQALESNPSGRLHANVYDIYVGWNEIDSPYTNDGRGGAIFISTNMTSANPTRNIYIHDNYFHDGAESDFVYSGDGYALIDNLYIYNNIFAGGTASRPPLYFQAGTKNAYVFNNTVYQTGSLGSMLACVANNSSVQKTIYSKNNIFYGKSGQTFFANEYYSGNSLIYSDHDLFYDPDGSTAIPSGSGITVTNAKTGNPLFVNQAGRDFHLQSASSAINAGTASVSDIVTQDYDGNSRPQGSGYDIGVYDYGTGGGGDTAPDAPMNFQIGSQ
jgi:hypothetical protein